MCDSSVHVHMWVTILGSVLSTCYYSFFRRVEQVLQSHVVRRSPRLSQRLGRVQAGNYTPHPLVAISYAATSRSSLESYSRAQGDREILNESGQSVPPSFDQDGEEQGLFSTKLDSPDSTIAANIASQPGQTHISAATAQLHYEDQPEKDVCQNDMPQHLFGMVCYMQVSALVFLIFLTALALL